MLLTTVVAARGAVWLSRDDGPPAQVNRHPEESAGRRRRVLLVTATLAVGLLLSIWLPAPAYHISRHKDLSTLVITLERRGGQGAAPSYSITLQ